MDYEYYDNERNNIFLNFLCYGDVVFGGFLEFGADVRCFLLGGVFLLL